MTKELQQLEKRDVPADGCDSHLDKLRKDCNDLAVKLHAIDDAFQPKERRLAQQLKLTQRKSDLFKLHLGHDK